MELVKPVTTKSSEEANISNETTEEEVTKGEVEDEGEEEKELWQDVWERVEGDLSQELATAEEEFVCRPRGSQGEEEAAE